MNDLSQLSAEHHTPETIEAIPATEYLKIRNMANELHESTAETLNTPLPASEYERQERLRSSMRLKLDEARSELSKQITDAEALKRELGITKGYVRSDESRFESAKIAAYIEEKKLRYENRSPNNP